MLLSVFSVPQVWTRLYLLVGTISKFRAERYPGLTIFCPGQKLLWAQWSSPGNLIQRKHTTLFFPIIVQILQCLTKCCSVAYFELNFSGCRVTLNFVSETHQNDAKAGISRARILILFFVFHNFPKEKWDIISGSKYTRIYSIMFPKKGTHLFFILFPNSHTYQ